MKTEQRLKELGIELTKPTSPMANYVNAVRTGNLLYLAGKGPGLPGHPLPVGKVGRDFTKEQGYEYARQTGLSLIAVMKAELGDLDRVKRIVKLLGMVNATPEFGEQPEADQLRVLVRLLHRHVLADLASDGAAVRFARALAGQIDRVAVALERHVVGDRRRHGGQLETQLGEFVFGAHAAFSSLRNLDDSCGCHQRPAMTTPSDTIRLSPVICSPVAST